jgi:hypothetical protein
LRAEPELTDTFSLPSQVMKNVLGASRGKKKQLASQVAVLNFPATERFRRENMFMLVMCRASVYKKYGYGRILCGVDMNGNDMGEPNHARDMRMLDEGRYCTLPDDENGGFRRWRLKGWDVTLAGDMLGVHAATPFYESPSAHLFCRECDADSRDERCYRPFSFHRRECNGECRPFTRRTCCLRPVCE